VLPWTSWDDARGHYEALTEVVAFDSEDSSRGVPILRHAELPSDVPVSRALFVDGRLATMGPDGIRVFDPADLRSPPVEVP
jgi:hypothetical protein